MLMPQPAPTAKPSMCAMVGLITRSSRPRMALIFFSYSMACDGSVNAWNCEMSVPDANALPPAPLRMNTRTFASWSTRSQAAASASYMPQVIALRASGRLNVRVANGPSMSNRVSGADMAPPRAVLSRSS